MRPTALRGDRRGVSTALGYVLNLGVMTVLVVGLVFTAGTYVEDQREGAIRAELVVVGEHLVADLGSADRLVASGASEVSVSQQVPESAAGVSYTVRVEESGGGQELVLSTRDPAVTVRFDLVTETPVAGGASGGDVRIDYDSAAGELEVRSD
ncbi:DUF7266 family protein [Halomarina ordinaria]|uniref:Secreted glycoprotein n=1 Tax=Halomarina ordinaria TaxID=3033939 RepID=A0ABD5U9W4_9EURY|nr:hypothetical protein [Halomarina sp. PSRA2]